jgi:hypothetical protein
MSLGVSGQLYAAKWGWERRAACFVNAIAFRRGCGHARMSTMIIHISRKHWITFGFLLGIQLFGQFASAHRIREVWDSQYLMAAPGLLVLRPNRWMGWEMLAIWIISAVFLDY